jgi:hypothetical protein
MNAINVINRAKDTLTICDRVEVLDGSDMTGRLVDVTINGGYVVSFGDGTAGTYDRDQLVKL